MVALCPDCSGQGVDAGLVKDVGSYSWNWLARAYLLAAMRTAGVTSLSITQDWTTEEVEAALLPDQSGWLPHWMEAKGWALKKLSAHLKVVPVEMLSCMACILGDSSMEGILNTTLKDKLQSIQAVRRKVKQRYGWEGHPSLIIGEALTGKRC